MIVKYSEQILRINEWGLMILVLNGFETWL